MSNTAAIAPPCPEPAHCSRKFISAGLFRGAQRSDHTGKVDAVLSEVARPHNLAPVLVVTELKDKWRSITQHVVVLRGAADPYRAVGR